MHSFVFIFLWIISIHAYSPNSGKVITYQLDGQLGSIRNEQEEGNRLKQASRNLGNKSKGANMLLLLNGIVLNPTS